MSGITVRHASEAERARWDELVGENPSGGDFVMAQPYAGTKAAFGWIPRHLVFERDGERISVALVMERRIALLGRYWYLPHGPAVADPGAAHEHIVALLDFVRAHEPRVFSVTVEPQLERTEQNLAATTSGEHSLSALGAVWRPGIHAGTSTAIVKIGADDEALLASFHKRCRNMISRARRDGVEVREYPATPETFAQMHRLMRLVGGGKADLRLRSNDYAERFWRGFSDAGLGRFYGIEVDGSPALLAFVIRVGTHAFYKDGGSERPRTTPGMSNYLQWHMMRQMRDAGATQYDMIGVPPKDRLDDPTARDYSLAPFKLSFAREVTEFIGGYDFGVKSRAFRIWQRIGLPVMQRWYRLRYRDLAFY